ncbi:hypothetical protein RRG08_067053 [Elysia crispata]|uniref:Uncharacterized protein n=1 Tax=Elysia crispata TaxID=231223 RepID=A0AAE1B8K9_9GAST|nr:hypothetical protein RRG08_067053 [Elysia crispata]
MCKLQQPGAASLRGCRRNSEIEARPGQSHSYKRLKGGYSHLLDGSIKINAGGSRFESFRARCGPSSVQSAPGRLGKDSICRGHMDFNT